MANLDASPREKQYLRIPTLQERGLKPLLVSVTDAAALIGSCRDHINKLLREGHRKAIRRGRRKTWITYASLEAYASGDDAA